MRLNACGRMRHTVVLQRQSTSKNSLGEYLDTWPTTIATRRALIEPINGREYWAKSGEHSEVTTRITLRYDATLSGLKPRDRAVRTDSSPNVVYDIVSVIRPLENELEIVLMCTRSYGTGY